ncbi:hypothetical protein EUGRSUZ_I02781 [Eucalyptus grandis]|uniref:Uncharacterized protein n=2 Tax=Eucalyptus grandis TaxID=71139 RepID=A0ACC3JKY6_EUCGR|nr:hypothetical protein EUGRSUZ_I02781 [Eucalyptus grandis]
MHNLTEEKERAGEANEEGAKEDDAASKRVHKWGTGGGRGDLNKFQMCARPRQQNDQTTWEARCQRGTRAGHPQSRGIQVKRNADPTTIAIRQLTKKSKRHN